MAEIVTTDGILGGKPRLKGHRIGVLHLHDVVQETSPEHAADQFDISLAAVHTALAYYYEHLEEMHQLRERQRDLEDELTDTALEPPADLRQ